eukprot:CAMPEP_0170542106 /NCGR_PEP_ID=MMETSP0211-20121228/1636_1 /TAXON_ID=311385 /ORGANISM="Pseudokeronopsis sp., Strain OXSARD2" /LENGTH=43 /DNA_ID= /DNA_START= /DNA_END= /DNA_ORIENTATION=
MRSDVLDNSDLVEHDNLRDEGDSLKPEAVAPDELPGFPSAVHD